MLSRFCKGVFVLLGIIGFALPSMASSRACYGPEELQAEQLLRLHSEMMVTTVTCHYGSRREDLVPLYTGFTQSNLDMLHKAEVTMTRFYQRSYGGKGVDRLDALRTKLANEFGQEIAKETAPAYCASHRDRVVALSRVSPESVRFEAGQSSARAYVSSCGSTKVAKKKKSRKNNHQTS